MIKLRIKAGILLRLEINMASIAIMAGGAVVNALAFSGTNYLFGKLGGAERKRHDLAMEKLSKAREAWSRNRQQRLDFINQSLQQQRHATQTFSNLGAAMEEYAKVTGRALPKLKDPPRVSRLLCTERKSKRW